MPRIRKTSKRPKVFYGIRKQEIRRSTDSPPTLADPQPSTSADTPSEPNEEKRSEAGSCSSSLSKMGKNLTKYRDYESNKAYDIIDIEELNKKLKSLAS